MMSERWRYQIRSGTFYALFMVLIIGAWESYTSSFEEAFMSKRFIIRLVIFLLTGIFVIGYFNWVAKKRMIKK